MRDLSLIQLPPDWNVVGSHHGDQDGDLFDILHGDRAARYSDGLQRSELKVVVELDKVEVTRMLTVRHWSF